MADEAVIVELHGDVKGGGVRYTCADKNAIAKGTLLFLVDPKTVSGAMIIRGKNAGIASTAKVAGDGQTTIGVWEKGIFDLKANGDANTITAGQLVCISGSNFIRPAIPTTDVISGCVIGRALESVSAGAVETIQVLVGSAF